MFINQAFAQDVAGAVTAAAGEGSFLISIAPLVLIFVIFYFLVIRPQSKRMKAHGEMLSELKKGDKIVTGGGVCGLVKKVEDRFVTVEIAKGTDMKILRSTITGQQSDYEPRDEKTA